jgi:leucyl/phenylalanyl-tRNA---protein transferase
VASDAITPDLLLQAYAIGLFPMAESADDPSLFWVEPRERGIIPLDKLVVSRSLAKVTRQDRFEIRIDTDFDRVIDGCATTGSTRDSTWINREIRRLYRALFDRGHVHTVEAYRDGALAGGLYGVALGGAFFGESMFHRETDASKVSLLHLAARLLQAGFVLLDAQFVTPHLASLGAVEVGRTRYRALLTDATARSAGPLPGSGALSGSAVLAILRDAAAKAGS